MYALLKNARIAPKKANLIAKMVRGMNALEAIEGLERTHKKAARLVEQLVRSAVANASHNSKQSAESLVIREIVVNQGAAYRRGVPMARGRVRPMKKFMSHISVRLGIRDSESGIGEKKKGKTSQEPTNEVQTGARKASKTPRKTKNEKASAHPKSQSSVPNS